MEEALLAAGAGSRQDWLVVEEKPGSETPPPLVGATLNCLEVALQARGLKDYEIDATRNISVGPQLGLFLFGGDDVENRQTNTLLVYYLQEKKWRKPPVSGMTAAKRSRHTATVVIVERTERLLVFGGVGATNALSLLDPLAMAWSHPNARSKPGEKERAKRRSKKAGGDELLSDSLLPCARFGHTSVRIGLPGEQRLLIFGGADFKGPLGDLYELNLEVDPMEWARPDVPGLPPPPSAKHVAAVVRDHMLLISGEQKWEGYLWALILQPRLAWVRSTLPDFPLSGVSRHTMVPYVTPRPHRREELLIFGGVAQPPQPSSRRTTAAAQQQPPNSPTRRP